MSADFIYITLILSIYYCFFWDIWKQTQVTGLSYLFPWGHLAPLFCFVLIPEPDLSHVPSLSPAKLLHTDTIRKMTPNLMLRSVWLNCLQLLLH